MNKCLDCDQKILPYGKIPKGEVNEGEIVHLCACPKSYWPTGSSKELTLKDLVKLK